MTIMGIDPGLATIGFSIIESDGVSQRLERCGVITTAAGLPVDARLQQIYSDMTELLDMFRPEAVSIETLFFNSNAKTAITVAEARGVLVLACANYGVPVFEYTPLQVKQSVTGYGRAQKNQVMAMVTRLLNLSTVPKPDDAADAVALALCHARSATSLLNLR